MKVALIACHHQPRCAWSSCCCGGRYGPPLDAPRPRLRAVYKARGASVTRLGRALCACDAVRVWEGGGGEKA